MANYAFDEEYEIKNRAQGLMYQNREKFTYKKMAKLLNDIVDKYTKDIPTQVGLNLPKLKKTNKPPKMALPKLKKDTNTEGATV